MASFPIVNNLWSYIREQKILKKHKEVSDFWKPIIASYFRKELPIYEVNSKKKMSNEKIIWQYWGQGIDGELPEVIQACFASVDKHKGDWTVIRLDDKMISEYIEFPEYVYQKIDCGIFNKTIFSDLLRLALLKLYGGVWLDATIYMTGSIPENLASQDYFMYQRDNEEIHKSFWKNSYAYYWNWDPKFKVNVLNSIFFAKKNGVVINTLLDIMLYYWATQLNIKDYFFFQILYDDLMKGYLQDQKCILISDVKPHIIQTKINGEYPYSTIDVAIADCNLHKMSYFKGLALNNFKSFVNRSKSFKN
ncbi:capsular polysaccharide synthesis protein [Chryseobacterium sp.]|uniref:capsular polysaccharide synthesis protein n=1 Tax=Chryseobacterium sp. TaxID=1871047 RepID=UPI00389095EB